VGVADLRDRALPTSLAGGVLGGHQPDEGHELLCPPEAAEVADLDDERERGQGVDPAQAAQPCHELAPGLLLGLLGDHAFERLDAAVDASVQCVPIRGWTAESSTVTSPPPAKRASTPPSPRPRSQPARRTAAKIAA
jgi:hypothetical protein